MASPRVKSRFPSTFESSCQIKFNDVIFEKCKSSNGRHYQKKKIYTLNSYIRWFCGMYHYCNVCICVDVYIAIIDIHFVLKNE